MQSSPTGQTHFPHELFLIYFGYRFKQTEPLTLTATGKKLTEIHDREYQNSRINYNFSFNVMYSKLATQDE